MQVALSMKNKLAFIDGTLPKPASTDSTFATWNRANNVIISWLYNSVSKDIITSILFVSTAQEIWDVLKTRFSRKNGPRIFQLRRQLMSLHQGMDDISTYYTKLKSIWEELSDYKPTFQCTCGGLQQLQSFTESEYMMSFLMGLNESFSQIRGQILLSDPLPSIGNVFSLVLQDEAQREISVTSSLLMANSDNIAFTVNSSQPATSRNRFTKKERPRCAHCDILGHTRDTCYKLVGYPPNYFKNRTTNTVNQVMGSPDNVLTSQSSNLTPDQCQQLINFLTNQMQADTTLDAIATNVTGICMNVALDNNYHTWIIDSGATSHICCFKHLFHSYTAIHDSHVLLPNSTKVKVEGIGSIKINDDIFLHNVLYIPTFRFKLLSLLTLINENSFRFTMEPNSFTLQDLKTLRKIGTAKQQQRLLVFEFPTCTFPSNCINSCNVVTYDTWHKRLGHVPKSVYRLITNKTDLSSIDSSYHCSICNIAKQNRLPFSNPNKFSPNCFDLIHADIWGPFRQPTYDGFRYFLTLVDDKSRFTWVYMLHNKSDCIHIIPQFVSYF
uniref:Retrovirus-related Pol polyprotein from transposon TNT 1-94 n=1 Tax=Cajanus cajan TaxID=3821 RepID=A0A151T0D0_CAJCA|nr:Retrovirus-related Pol polyprotein from transposon TNT 1-94 [Cajanus cajan]